MARFVSNLVRMQIALLNPLLKRMDISTLRKLQDGLGALGTKAMASRVSYSDDKALPIEAVWAEPTVFTPGKAILYLHGGSYTAGTLTYAKGFGGVLADKTGYRVFCVGYRLAPEDPYPAALEDALCAYRYLLEDHAPEDIVFVGESAGGGLCYCLCLKLKEIGLPQPSRIVAISPWTDLTMSSELDEKERNDPVLSSEKLRTSAQMYAAGQLDVPTVSPLFGDLEGLPPSLIIAGTDEILLCDSVDMAERLKAQGCDCELHIEPDMWHVYVLYGIPEAREAVDRMRAFIESANEGNAYG
ncbi:MAG: alpha/beta hydrolase [Christensenellales bacterium]|jgi:monoterpene epsilon-lactone hydrolase